MKDRTVHWVTILGVAASLLLALRLIGPAVPNEIDLLTGPEGSTFHEDGLRYREFFGRHGVTVRLQETSGSVENLATIIEADVPTAAFLWGLLDASDPDKPVPEGVQSLGTMYLQPLWVFVKKAADLDRLPDLRGSKVEAGERGSDARLLAVFVFRAEGVRDELEFADDESMTPDQVLAAMRDDQVGAIVAVGEPDSELIDQLLRSPELKPLPIRRAEAFAINYPFLQPVRYPEGAQDLAANIPDHDLQLLAARVQLVVSDQFPTALADLLLQAASEIHGGPTPFSARGDFPSPETAPLPLNRAARKFYTDGPPKLQKYLPFRVATWIDRFLTAGVAFASAAVTIIKIIPVLIALPFKLKVRRSYSELDEIERAAAAKAEPGPLLERLDTLDQSTAAIKVPLSGLQTEWLELRQFLHDVGDRVSASQAREPAA